MARSPAVCIFEDERVANFHPLTYTRPVFDLRCGLRTLFDKIAARYSGCAVTALCRPQLPGYEDTLRTAPPPRGRDPLVPRELVLFVNGRLLPRPGVNLDMPPEGPDALYVQDGQLVAARPSGYRLAVAALWLGDADSASVPEGLSPELPLYPVDERLVAYPWDLIHANGAEIAADFAALGGACLEGSVHPSAAIHAPDAVHVAAGAEVDAMTVLDARTGPIAIETGARIEPFSYLQGPCAILAGARVVSGRIRESTTIGPHCRVGGEVEGSIFQAHSNKYHDGFVGHSYLGEWVNVGALATTSDLKNTYGSIRVDANGELVDTGHMKMGSVVGDHTKLGIGVLLNSGSSVGLGCNLFGGGMQPKAVPSFIWDGDGQYAEHDLARMLSTAATAMSRRGVEQTEPDRALLRHVFQITAAQRRGAMLPASDPAHDLMPPLLQPPPQPAPLKDVAAQPARRPVGLPAPQPA